MSSTGFIEHRISHVPAPPADNPATRIDNVASVLSFLSSQLFSALPSEQQTAFPHTLAKPTSTSLLNNLLIPCLPTSFDGLPVFLDVAQKAIQFEDDFIIRLLGADGNVRPIKNWVEGLAGHYERQRRKLILDHSRTIIASSAIGESTFTVEVEISATVNPDVVLVQEEEPAAAAPRAVEEKPKPKAEPELSPVKDDAWGFDDEDGSTAVEEDGWGFNDDIPESPKELVKALDPVPRTTSNASSPVEAIAKEPEAKQDAESTDAWGWNDEEEPVPEGTEETAWDDPWDDGPIDDQTAIDTRPPPAPSIPAVSSPPPKAATRLEKAANKGKKAVNGNASGSIPSLSSVTSPPAPSFQSPSGSPNIPNGAHTSTAKKDPFSPQPPVSASSGKRPAQLMSTKLKEYYAVSKRMKQVVQLVEEVLEEGRRFSSSHLFPGPSSSSAPGSVILLSAPSVLDLYRALWPVVHSKQLEAPAEGIMFSNDCNYLADEVQGVVKRLPVEVQSVTKVKEKLEESERSVRMLGESWWHNVIKNQRESIHTLLEEGGQGFTYTGDQDRYDECEAAINQVLQQIRRLSPKLKKILTKSKYYTALGSFVDAALNKMLTDVLALPDIPELESHRLSELCRIFNALEGLFVEDPDQPSFVVAYVPSWLKFSYLSELLEATMADITYLFETGALVDFSVDELVRLVKALFSDNPRRTDTINKLMGGHPVPS